MVPAAADETQRIEWADGEHVTLICPKEEADELRDKTDLSDELHALSCRCSECGGLNAWLDRNEAYQRQCHGRTDSLDLDQAWTVWSNAAWRTEDAERWAFLGLDVPTCLDEAWDAEAVTPAEAHARLVEYEELVLAALRAAEADRLDLESPDPLLRIIGAWDPSTRPPKPPTILEAPRWPTARRRRPAAPRVGRCGTG